MNPLTNSGIVRVEEKTTMPIKGTMPIIVIASNGIARERYTHFDEHGTPQLFDINVPCIFPPILISMSQLMSQLSYPGFLSSYEK